MFVQHILLLRKTMSPNFPQNLVIFRFVWLPAEVFQRYNTSSDFFRLLRIHQKIKAEALLFQSNTFTKRSHNNWTVSRLLKS